MVFLKCNADIWLQNWTVLQLNVCIAFQENPWLKHSIRHACSANCHNKTALRENSLDWSRACRDAKQSIKQGLQHWKVAIGFCLFRQRVVGSVGVDVDDVAQMFERFIGTWLPKLRWRAVGQNVSRPRPKPRGRGQNLEAEAREFRGRGRGIGQKLEAEAKFLASRPVWPRGFNISAFNLKRR